MNIPKKLAVGFQDRRDTYTGKLAYVTYYRGNKLAKEKSWKGWCSTSIPTKDYDNEPLTGFVINKKVGDYHGNGYDSYGRYAYCRVLDPRGFEFEIKIDNLILILETESCVRKELTGSYVYAWYGEELWLIPTSSNEYQSQVKEDAKIKESPKVMAKTLILGATYVTKSGDKLVYIGKLKFNILDKDSKEGDDRYSYIGKYRKFEYFTFYKIGKVESWDYRFYGYKSISGVFKYRDGDKVVNIDKYLNEYNAKYNFEFSDIKIYRDKVSKSNPLTAKYIDKYNHDTSLIFRLDLGSKIEIYQAEMTSMIDGMTKSQIEKRRGEIIRPSERTKLVNYLDNWDKLSKKELRITLYRTLYEDPEGWRAIDECLNKKESSQGYYRQEAEYKVISNDDPRVLKMEETKEYYTPKLTVKGKVIDAYYHGGSESKIERK